MARPIALFLTVCFLSLHASAAVTGVVMTADGQPVAGARVSLFAFETTAAARARLLSSSPERVPLASAQTDSKGAFSLDSPKQAVVDLAIVARGFEPVQQRVERDEDIGAIALRRAENRKGVISSGGKPVAGATVAIDYGSYELVVRTDDQGRYEAPDPKQADAIVVIHPNYAVDEKIWMGGRSRNLDQTLSQGVALKGTVVDEKNAPVSGATIAVDGWPVAKSDAEGAFTIAHAPSRWTTLSASTESLVGERAFAAAPAPIVIHAAKAAVASGRILDAKTKLPIAGAVVRAGARRFGPDRREAAGVEVDAKGAYSIPLPPGTYVLAASHPAYDAKPGDVALAAGQRAARDVALEPLARVGGAVLDEDKRPVAAAFVTPDRGDPFMRGRPPRMMRDETPTVSGPDGRFTIRVAADSDLSLKAAKKGLPAAKSESLELTPGERRTGVVLIMPSGLAVHGRVTDAQNNPLSGIAVTTAEAEGGPRGMVRMMIGGPPSRDDTVVRTASDGTYTLRLKEGTYDFTFKGEGFAPRIVRGQNVKPGEAGEVNASLEPSVEISGRVMRGGTPIENAFVSAFVMGADADTVSGPDGSFTLSGLAPGSVRLFVRKEEDFVQEMRTLTAPARDVVIEVAEGGRVSGRVVEKGSRKPITTFQAGFSTSRGGGGMISMGPPQLKDFTSDDGTFVLENVPAGSRTLIALAAGFAAGRMNVTVEPGKPVTGVEIELDAGVRLTGKVTGPTGAPLADVHVEVAPSPTGGFSARGMDRGTSTDANGEYVLDTLEAGEETIVFVHPKHLDKRQSVTLKGRETRLDVQMSAGQRLTGTVVTEAGAPVGEAEVTAFSGGSGERARTNASGTFTFDSLSPGRYRFTASKSGFADGSVEDVDIAAGAPVRITLRTGGAIYGRVTGLTPQELSQVMVSARSGRSEATAAVDAAGNYRIEGAPIGTVQVNASLMAPGFGGARSSRRETVEVTAGSSQQVDLEFRSDVVISGRVTRNGTPLRDANVMFMPRGGTSRANASGMTDADGRYSVSGLEEGQYNAVVIDMQRFSPYTTTYEVRGSDTFDITFTTAQLHGRVIDAGTSEPVANASVQLRSTAPGSDMRMGRTSVTDSAGTFAFDSVAPGPFSLTATQEGYGNQTIDLNVRESGNDDIELKLMRNDGVALEVVDERDGRSINSMVFVYDAQGRLVHESRGLFGIEPDGGKTTLPLAPGSYTAAVHSMGYASRNVSLRSPSTAKVGMTPGGTIAIRSKHSALARFRLIDANGLLYPRFATGTQSRELLPSPGTTTVIAAPGRYTLQLVGDNDVVLDSTQVVVEEGGTVGVEI